MNFIKKYLLFLLIFSPLFCLSNFDVLLYQDKPNEEGIPGGWPAEIQPVAPNVPERGAPWIRMTKEQLDQQFQNNKAAYDAWYALRESKERNLPRINQELENRLKGNAWEGILRANMLDFELLGLAMKLALQNVELSILLTKAIAPSSLTNNLTAQERQRVAELRKNLNLSNTPDVTTDDRQRAVYLRDEIKKIYNLWVKARELRAKIQTNSTPINLDTEEWPSVDLGE